MQGRVLGFSTSSAHVWGQLKAKWDAAGVVVPTLDSQIAAIAKRHSLTVVTRNTGDYAKTGVKVLNPFG
jgi:predicted nucleic acid-binding protein